MGLTAKKIAGSVPPGGAGGQPRGGTLRRSFPRTWQIFRTVVTSKTLIHSMCSVAAAVDGLFAVVPSSLTLFIHSSIHSFIECIPAFSCLSTQAAGTAALSRARHTREESRGGGSL